MRTREELAWAAGLFEEEGCFSRLGSDRAISATIRMTDLDVLGQFRCVVGLGTIHGPYARPKNKPNWKETWLWRVSTFEETQAIVAFLWPWLKTCRRAKARNLLLRFHAAEPESRKVTRDRTIGILAALRRQGVPRTRWHAGGPTQTDIAKQFGVSPAMITHIKQRGVM